MYKTARKEKKKEKKEKQTNKQKQYLRTNTSLHIGHIYRSEIILATFSLKRFFLFIFFFLEKKVPLISVEKHCCIIYFHYFFIIFFFFNWSNIEKWHNAWDFQISLQVEREQNK